MEAKQYSAEHSVMIENFRKMRSERIMPEPQTIADFGEKVFVSGKDGKLVSAEELQS